MQILLYMQCMCALVGARGWHRVSFSVVLHLIGRGRVSHLSPEFAGSAT